MKGEGVTYWRRGRGNSVFRELHNPPNHDIPELNSSIIYSSYPDIRSYIIFNPPPPSLSSLLAPTPLSLPFYLNLPHSSYSPPLHRSVSLCAPYLATVFQPFPSPTSFIFNYCPSFPPFTLFLYFSFFNLTSLVSPCLILFMN